MKEDIKILENVIQRREQGLCYEQELTEKFYQAIENLIARNKELEKYAPKPDCAEPVEKTEEMLNMNYVKHNFIPKSKIIEWLDRFELEEELQNEYDEFYGSEAVTKILKKLLKE